MDSSLQRARRRSGYEPSDTETDWHESPKREIRRQPSDNAADYDLLNRHEIGNGTPRRRHSKSPYRPRGEADGVLKPDLRRNVSPLSRRTYSDRYVSPFVMSEQRRANCSDNAGKACQFSQSERRTNTDNDRKTSVSPFAMYDRRSHFDTDKAAGEYFEASRGRERSGYGRRAASTPKGRLRVRGQQISNDQGEHKKEHRKLSPLPNNHKHGGPLGGEINEMVAKAKISRGLNRHAVDIESTDSISPGDIFFSRVIPSHPKELLPKPPGYVDATAEKAPFNNNSRGMSQMTTNSTSGVSRQSSTLSGSTTTTSASARKFIANRRKSHSDVWFSCIKKGTCRKSNKSPEKDRPFDEALFISNAVVVERLRPLWADKHQPALLSRFTFHKQEALLLQKIANSDIFPHILMKGPPGTCKKALTMALLQEIYGESVSNISHDLRYFHIMEPRPMQIVVPVTSSPHHVELNVYSEPKAAYALTALVKKISSEHAAPPEISVVPLRADYKVLVLYDVDKATDNMQHLIKWIMDCYTDSCKLLISCEDDVDVIESVKSRCKVIEVEPLKTHEVMEVLSQIAKEEGFELSMSFAAKIANKSKHNLRRAIMALEACKAHNYPFSEDQPIPLGWEDVVVELAADILADPMSKRLFIVRGKIQKLLADYVHPRLILLKLVEQLLHGIEASRKREVYYWYAYYDKKLPIGMTALLKLEEFVAKFMSIYRKGSSAGRQF
ncbi:uncharacterized protein LOC127240098 [Andrographis paniculata]|uniref:uncharacterized protein LOC127240098 n=1 Tax=Andrographis paniculata TaxID=175694 RepID=UPI0021E80580|nr:uncharacterized protein LOC127240098 [Andrographis paniculata]